MQWRLQESENDYAENCTWNFSARRTLQRSTSESVHLWCVVYQVEYSYNHGDGNTIPAAAALWIFDPFAWSRHACKAEVKSFPSMHLGGGEIGRSYEGLYLPVIRTSMCVVTVTQNLLGHVSYSLHEDLVHCTITKNKQISLIRSRFEPSKLGNLLLK